MRYYPVLLDLHDKYCLVVGVGHVGTRKVRSLLSCAPGRLRIVDTRPPDSCWQELIEQGLVEYRVRTFAPEDLDGCFLVIASTSDEALNWRISRMCAERRILCNIVDQPEKCTFILPAMHSQGDLTITVSTSGSSPALAKKIREDIASCFGPEYAEFLAIMRRLRSIILELNLPTPENTALFRKLTQSQLLDAVQTGEKAQILGVLRRHLPETLHHRLEDALGESD